MCKNLKVWCGPHANSWPGLVTQADEQGPEAVAKVKVLLTPGHEVERGEATGAYAKKNPPDKKYAKKQLFDVMTYSGGGNARAMAAGVSMATVPTMAGMVAALSGVYFGTWLEHKAQVETEKLEDLLQHHQ